VIDGIVDRGHTIPALQSGYLCGGCVANNAWMSGEVYFADAFGRIYGLMEVGPSR